LRLLRSTRPTIILCDPLSLKSQYESESVPKAICDRWGLEELHSPGFARMMLVATVAAQREKMGEPESEVK
jgi:hypothetical protein